MSIWAVVIIPRAGEESLYRIFNNLPDAERYLKVCQTGLEPRFFRLVELDLTRELSDLRIAVK